MKKSFLLLALLSVFMFSNAEEYYCDMGLCFELGKFKAETYRTADGEPYKIEASGMSAAMTIYKDWEPELLTMEERVELLKKRLDKAATEYARITNAYKKINFTEEDEYLGMIPAHCLTGFVEMGHDAAQYKFYLFEKDNTCYCVEFHTSGWTKDFEKKFRTMIDSFYMPQ